MGFEIMVMDVFMFNYGVNGCMVWIYFVLDVMVVVIVIIVQIVIVLLILDFFMGVNVVQVFLGNDGGVDVVYWQLGGCLFIGLVNLYENDFGWVEIKFLIEFFVLFIVVMFLGDIKWFVEGGKGKKRQKKFVVKSVKGFVIVYVVLE